MPDDSSRSHDSTPNKPDALNPSYAGKTCSKCGCNLTYVPEPVICPQCGASSNRVTILGRLISLNVAALFLALWVLSSSRRGFGWGPLFGPGPGLGVICIVMPLQVVVAFWAFFAYVAREEIGPVRRWLWVGAILPFVVGVFSFLAVKYF